MDAVARLPFGSLKTEDLRAKFGAPHQVIAIPKSTDEAWIYHGSNEARIPYQRLAFTVDRERKIVEGGLWTPLPSEALHDLPNAIAHFPNAAFKIEEEGLIGHHSYSDNVSYTDSKWGVSLDVRKSHRSVSSVSFGPSAIRSLSNTE